jgi:hypothetical protein
MGGDPPLDSAGVWFWWALFEGGSLAADDAGGEAAFLGGFAGVAVPAQALEVFVGVVVTRKDVVDFCCEVDQACPAEFVAAQDAASDCRPVSWESGPPV